MTLRITAAAFTLAGILAADSLTLKDGRVIRGTFVRGDARHIEMAVDREVSSFPITDVANLEFTSLNGSNSSAYPSGSTRERYPQPGYQQGSPQPGYEQQPTYSRNRQDEPRVLRPERYGNTPAPSGNYGSGYQVPSGTVLQVRLIDSVDSDRDRPGQTFRATLDEAVMNNGQVVVPRGADITAKLVNAEQSGKFRGRTELTLDLDSIRINGQQYDIQTGEVTQASSARGNRTAAAVGGTAALGAIIGAIAGGGQGAAVGAASGAAVGGAAQVLTHGQRVKIPSETRLSFTLQQPLNLQ